MARSGAASEFIAASTCERERGIRLSTPLWEHPCKVGPSVGVGFAICDVADHLFPPGCAPNSGARIEIQRGQPREFVGCRTDTLTTRQHVGLLYGATWRSASITCESQTSGVTCTDAFTRHFFFFARESYRLG